jgi:hypothetical protein
MQHFTQKRKVPAQSSELDCLQQKDMAWGQLPARRLVVMPALNER